MKSKISCWRFVRSIEVTPRRCGLGRTCVREGSGRRRRNQARASRPVPGRYADRPPRAGGGIGRRARLRALWDECPVEVRVLFGALTESPASAGLLSFSGYGASVRRQPLLGLGQGAGQALGVREPRPAVGARVDAQVQPLLVQDGHPQQLVLAPELGLVVVGLLRPRDDDVDLAHRGAPCCWSSNQVSKSVAPMRAPSPGVSSPPCSSVPKYRAAGSPMTVRSSPVAANRRRAQASMPIFSGPPSSTRPPTGARVARSATVAATSSAATSCISPGDSRTVSPSAPASAIWPRNSKNCVAFRMV